MAKVGLRIVVSAPQDIACETRVDVSLPSHKVGDRSNILAMLPGHRISPCGHTF